jgi:hypothetical protein
LFPEIVEGDQALPAIALPNSLSSAANEEAFRYISVYLGFPA